MARSVGRRKDASVDLTGEQRVSRIKVLVATTSKDLQAELILVALSQCTDMSLVCDRVVLECDVKPLLAQLSPGEPCGLVLCGQSSKADSLASGWLARCSGLVLLRVNIADDLLQITARSVGMGALLDALRSLATRTFATRESCATCCAADQNAGGANSTAERANGGPGSRPSGDRSASCCQRRRRVLGAS
jgi:hypothetical protein